MTARKDGLPKRNGPLPGNGGRPPKPIDREVMKRAAGIGCNVAEIAALNGISFVQFYQRLKTDPTLQAELDEARNNGRAMLRRYQWQQAAAGNPAMLIWLGKQMLGQKEKTEVSASEDGSITFLHLVAAREFTERLNAQVIDGHAVAHETTADDATPPDLMAPALE